MPARRPRGGGGDRGRDLDRAGDHEQRRQGGHRVSSRAGTRPPSYRIPGVRPRMAPLPAPPNRHPWPRLRFLALAWLAVYLPSYALAYGVSNFLFLCNLGVGITAAGVLAGDRLLLSSQAVAAPVIGLAWALDAGWRVATGAHLYGGTEYMWDPQYPLFTRLLSLYHLVWPLLTLACVRRLGYDRRGWGLQAAVAAVALVVSRLLTAPEENVNFAFRDPLFGIAFAPPALHLALTWVALAGVAYAPTHAALARTFLAARAGPGRDDLPRAADAGA